jgi:hypothetical protein
MALTAVLASGCLQSTVISTGGSSGPLTSTGVEPGSSGSSVGASSSGGTTSGTASSSTGTSTGSGTGTGVSSSTGGASSTGTPPSPLIDGGYVFCLSASADAGWLCRPGTYLCDLNAKPGSCFQCLSDSDCANRDLPTYDSRRQRCDLSSGVPGYQNFCQECTSDADCASDPAAPFCDLNPSLFGGLLPTLDDLGFESCGRTETDCRKDGGPPCGINASCDPVNGGCEMRSLACTTDADCTGLFANSNQPMAYCFEGACTACASGVCPGGLCNTDADCGNPDGSVSGLHCNEQVCECTDSSQCGGETPVCLPAGQFLAFCGCSDDRDCGDAGLHCFYGYAFCGISCSAPEAPACPTDMPICDLDSGLCGYCLADEDCVAAHVTAGNFCNQYGICGCATAADCPDGQSCLPGKYYATCGVASADCDPATCPGTFCNWDAGTCVGSSSGFNCITDYDCAGYRCVAGQCAQCVDDNDCIVEGRRFPGEAFGTYCDPSAHNCLRSCLSDVDCVGNPSGPACLVYVDGGLGQCQDDYCQSNVDCAPNFYGHVCNLDGGTGWGACTCFQDSDCNPGDFCQMQPGSLSYCFPAYCQTDADCAAGERCDPGATCRTHCDDGGACGAITPVCDTANDAGENGQTLQGADPSVVWCYGCFTGADCLGGLGCDTQYGHVCDACYDNLECASGTCFNGTCLAACDGGSCGAGRICDVENVAGNGANLCYQCLGPIDCPGGEGCNGQTHLCGTCSGPNDLGGSSDCPPGNVCSNYWSPVANPAGVCLQQCDDHSCPADRPLCEVFPSFSQGLPYCFGCLTDADCADAGRGAWCDTSLSLTFTCQLPIAG